MSIFLKNGVFAMFFYPIKMEFEKYFFIFKLLVILFL